MRKVKALLAVVCSLMLANPAIAYDPTGKQIKLDTSTFDGNLSGSVTNVQLLAEALDELVAGVGGSNTQVQFNDSGTVAGDSGLTWNKTTDALSVTGSVLSGLLNAYSTTTQPIIYAFPQSGDLTKYIQFYHNGTAGFLTSVNPAGGDFNITSNNGNMVMTTPSGSAFTFATTGGPTLQSTSGNLTINVPTGSYINLNDRMLGVNNVTSWVTSGGGAETPAWFHLFSNNSVQSTGGFSHIQITAGRDGASVSDQSNGLFVNATGDYVWGAHLNVADSASNSWGFVVGNHGVNSAAGVFYTDNSATNTGVMINSGVSGAFNLLQFRSDYHPFAGATGTAFTGKYISLQSGTTEHSYIDYTGAAKLAGASGAPVLTLGNAASGVDYEAIRIDGQSNDFKATWLEDEAILKMTSSVTSQDAGFIVGNASAELTSVIGLSVTGEIASAFGISGSGIGIGFIESRTAGGDGSIFALITNDGSNIQSGDPLGEYSFSGLAGSMIPAGADIVSIATGNWTDDGAGNPTSVPAKMILRTASSGAALPIARMVIDSDGIIDVLQDLVVGTPTVLLSSDNQIMSLQGYGGTYNECLDLDFDTSTSNLISVTSSCSSDTVDFNTIALDSDTVKSAGTQIGYTLSVYAAGTAYSLTGSQAKLDFGTTDPVKVLDKAGTYLIWGNAQLKYNAATYAANQTATVKLRRTNNTAADVTGATRTLDLRIITTITDNAGIASIPPVVYTTSNTTDSIEMYGAVSVTPAAGSVDVTSAEIFAVRIA